MAQHIHNIIPNLFIGDYTASQSLALLDQHNIRHIVAAMKQSYDIHPGFDLLRVPIDDTDKTNICEWFDVVGDWIQDRLDGQQDTGLLVHCAAGVSRSTTLVAAYLMKIKNLTAEEAVFYITSKRPQTQPTEFFLFQLEMYGRCNCQWDPIKYQEQRRFVMGFIADEMKDGIGAKKLVLAYYPSPAPSPLSRPNGDEFFSSFSMTPIPTNNVETIETKITSSSPPPRKRFTQSKTPSNPPKTPEIKEVEKLGKGVISSIKGKKIRCKMCSRELAARDHVLVHLPGIGQDAFSVQKRDTKAYRNQVPENLVTDESGVKNLRVSIPPPPPIMPSSSSSEIKSPIEKEINSLPLTSPPLLTSHKCQSYFVEPLSWMSNVLDKGELVGKLMCPNLKCGVKLGSFDWAGVQCSCGAWITPGFQISRSKVDEV